jgi:predicted transcriptional regulator
MRAYYVITPENAKELRKELAKKKNVKFKKRLLAVALRGEGYTNAQSASIVDLQPTMVSRYVADYCENGLESLLCDKRKFGNHRSLSEAEEKDFFARIDGLAEKGEIKSINDIKSVYEQMIGKEKLTDNAVLYVLKKHNKSFGKYKRKSKRFAKLIRHQKSLENL